MQKQIIQTDRDLRELCQHGTIQFPMSVNHDDLQQFEDQSIRCHWHNELEFVTVQEGVAEYHILQNVCRLHAGQTILINSNVPHSAVPFQDSHVKLLTIIVHPDFLYDAPGSSVEELYFRPFLHNRKLPFLLLDHSMEWAAIPLSCISNIEKYYFSRPYGFELKIKALLCNLFFELFSHLQPELQDQKTETPVRLNQLQILLDYLHSHYSQQISLQELAALIHSTRETCCRFFKQMTGITITCYLTDYRISRSLALLSGGQYSITQVAVQTGFSSASRFAAAFRSRMGCSPRDYIHQDFSYHI